MSGVASRSVEQRLLALEDRLDIAELTARYALAVNQGWAGVSVDVASFPDIFLSDATWESRAMGVRAEGLPAIIAGAEAGTKATDFSMHSYTNPVIAIHGDRAESRWLLFIASRRNAGSPNMVFLEDRIAYARTARGWRISSVERRFGMELVDGASKHVEDG